MGEKIDWGKQLDKLISYSKDIGFNVVFKRQKNIIAAIDFNTNEIILQYSFSKEKKMYILLHELGHYIISKNSKKYKNGVGYVFDNFSKSSMTSKTAEVEEEFEAWKAGRELAEKLNLKIQRNNFERLKSKMIVTYLLWAVQVKLKDKNDMQEKVINITNVMLTSSL